jgi:EpsI family protein
VKRASSWTRFLPLATVMALTVLFLDARSRPERLPPHEGLDSFPTEVGKWRDIKDIQLDSDTRAILGPGEFIERLYQAPEESYVDLFIAYFPSQRSNDTIHDPAHCLPGSGWIPVVSKRTSLDLAGGARITANQWVIARGADRQIVVYWYQSHNRTQASAYLARFYLVEDAIRLNRTDGALVRLITPLGDGESPESGVQRIITFASQVVPLLGNYIPG